MKKLYIFFSAIVIMLAAVAHNYSSNHAVEAMQDGYYTAEASSYDYGWKEFITIYVNKGKIVTAEFDSYNSAGFIKSWDMDYMRAMNAKCGNYPNKYTRNYVSELVSRQSAEGIDAMSGATESFESFKKLADAAIKQARTGDAKVAFVDLNQEER